MKKFISLMLIFTIILSACGTSDSNEEGGNLIFWTAPNIQQFEFWNRQADAYNSSNDSGFTIEVQQMPESPSSEAGIQNAIATGEPPIASSNITRGFATELHESDAIKNLDEMDGFSDLVESRNMDDVLSNWGIDGGNYVFPIFSSPMLMAWNTDILSSYGINEIPTTFDDTVAIAKNFEGSDQFLMDGTKYMIPEDWWQQWYFTFTYYYSDSYGQQFFENNELLANDESMVNVMTYINDLSKESNGLLTDDAIDPFENELAASTVIGGWKIRYWKDSYPDLVYKENYELTNPVNSQGDGEYTFADAKGIVFYDGYEDEEYSEIINFMKYVFTEEGDLDWVETTNLMPARDDLLENDYFTSFFDENPALIPFAEAVPYAIPPMNSGDMVEIQTQLGKNIQEMIIGDTSPEDAWDKTKEEILDITNE